jgi:hypothetical protein
MRKNKSSEGKFNLTKSHQNKHSEGKLNPKLELGIRAKVCGPTRLTRSPHGLKTNYFLPVYILIRVGWTVKTAGSRVWPMTCLYLIFCCALNIGLDY